ncbi:putative HVA22-like protein g [Hordeum vulgare]|nr:putative HVA22-like protein g [Hordeum vulgare]
MGGFVSRILLLVFGYAYPAYECYKTVELNKPEIDQLISGVSTEAKLLFFIYLWYPRTKHENEIDRNLLELRARASDVVVVYVQKVAAVGQNTFFDVLKYVASQSPSQKSKQQRSQVKQDDISGSHDI